MSTEQYFPCLKDWDTGEISKRVGPAMPFQQAVDHLKQHHSGAWQRANCCPQPVEHEFFKDAGPYQG